MTSQADIADDSDGTLTVEEISVSEALKRIERIKELYAAGHKIFPREVLADADRQLEKETKVIYIKDFEGIPRKYGIIVPPELLKEGYSPAIHYSSIESLTHLNPRNVEEGFAFEYNPLSMCYNNNGGGSDLETSPDMGKDLDQCRLDWSMSQTRESLIKSLSLLATVKVEQIIGFGLGSMRRPQSRDRFRSYWQHLAIETIATELSSPTGIKIVCYAQDPAYRAADLLMLEKMGILPLADPKGFLAVNDSTLVMSISPNVPVKQIIADAEWPVAMLWNTVKPEREGKPTWKLQKISGEDGEEVWASPFTTDPDSSRVRSTISHYNSHEFQDFDDKFGDLTLYVRQKSP